MHVSCPKCDATYEVADAFEGSSLKCTACSTVFRARLNRAAIKHFGDDKVEGKWPVKAPTLSPTKVKGNQTVQIAVYSVLGVVAVVALICSFIFVYLANSPSPQDPNVSSASSPSTSTNVD